MDINDDLVFDFDVSIEELSQVAGMDPPQSRVSQLGPWTCSVTLEDGLSELCLVVSIRFQPLGMMMVDDDLQQQDQVQQSQHQPLEEWEKDNMRYSRLQIYSLAGMDDTQSLILESPIQQSETLTFQGMQGDNLIRQQLVATIEPDFVRHHGRFVFRVLLSCGYSNVNGSNSNNFNDGDAALNPEYHIRKFKTFPHPPPSSLFSRNNYFSMESQLHLKGILERPVNSDIQLSFPHNSYPFYQRSSTSIALNNGNATQEPNATRRTWSNQGESGQQKEEHLVLRAHSCVLKTVKSSSINRLLSTCPPCEQQQQAERQQPRSITSTTTIPHHNPPLLPSISSNTDDITNIGANSGHHNETSAMRAPLLEPIREIRFEDSPPGAVEAVLRYIYLRQWPVLEPLCGYTVKDLMALATYLQLESLQELCIDLVLGRIKCNDHHDGHIVYNNNRRALVNDNSVSYIGRQANSRRFCSRRFLSCWSSPFSSSPLTSSFSSSSSLSLRRPIGSRLRLNCNYDSNNNVWIAAQDCSTQQQTRPRYHPYERSMNEGCLRASKELHHDPNHTRLPCQTLQTVTRHNGPRSATVPRLSRYQLYQTNAAQCTASLENLLQVLFSWGYKFPKMRTELVRALAHTHGRQLFLEQAGGEVHNNDNYSEAACSTHHQWTTAIATTSSSSTSVLTPTSATVFRRNGGLERFREHEAYREIIHELVIEHLMVTAFHSE
ncbi:hypothetical protein BX616_001830 [Lobosporangium transversale]|nr:hypothetical protein BX616_001830 [Lobosporangium transversale]